MVGQCTYKVKISTGNKWENLKSLWLAKLNSTRGPASQHKGTCWKVVFLKHTHLQNQEAEAEYRVAEVRERELPTTSYSHLSSILWNLEQEMAGFKGSHWWRVPQREHQGMIQLIIWKGIKAVSTRYKFRHHGNGIDTQTDLVKMAAMDIQGTVTKE